MKLLSATDLAIAVAIKAGTLSVEEKASRFPGETYFAIADEKGIIEVALTKAEADARIDGVKSAV